MLAYISGGNHLVRSFLYRTLKRCLGHRKSNCLSKITAYRPTDNRSGTTNKQKNNKYINK